jgi:hypothetical protein
LQVIQARLSKATKENLTNNDFLLLFLFACNHPDGSREMGGRASATAQRFRDDSDHEEIVAMGKNTVPQDDCNKVNFGIEKIEEIECVKRIFSQTGGDDDYERN